MRTEKQKLLYLLLMIIVIIELTNFAESTIAQNSEVSFISINVYSSIAEENHIVSGSNKWVNLSPIITPSPREGHAMSYDTKNDKVILFGGLPWNNETWSYDFNINNWTNMKPTTSPPARWGHGMVYDSRNNLHILFGGWKGNSTYNDTWAYDYNNNTWTKMNPSNSPSKFLSSSSMVDDSKNNRIILFAKNETWSYDYNNNTWKNLNPPEPRPSMRGDIALTYDSKENLLILFGGYTGQGRNNETWTYDYDSNSWTNKTPSINPQSSIGSTIAYDSQTNWSVLFGGCLDIFCDLTSNDTWLYNYSLNMWINVSQKGSPSPRAGHAIVYDSNDDRIILFGGHDRNFINNNETWCYEFNSIPPFVTSTYPQNGAKNVSLITKIVVVFSEEMEKNATNKAISSMPSISGGFTWDSSAKIVTLTSTTNLTPNTLYAVTIATLAKSQTGINMSSPYKFSFTTIPAKDVYSPFIVKTNPRNQDINVSINTDMIIQWNESMNRSSAENAFLSNPTILCKWSWSSVNQTCTPITPLQPNMQYNITMTTVAEDIAGNHMLNDYLFSFRTEVILVPPIVVKTDPINGSKGVPINTRIIITFSKGMNRTATESVIGVSPSVAWTATWSSGDTEITITLSTRLQQNTSYAIAIGTGAKSTEGANLASPYTFTFTTKEITYPTVIATIPVNGSTDVDVNSQIVITFSETMEKNATENAISISSSSIAKMAWSNENRIVTLTAYLELGATYIVRILTGAKGLEGNAMLKAYTFSFTTRQEGISNMTISLSLLILFIVILLFIVLFLMRKRSKKAITKKVESEKEPSVPPVSEKETKASGLKDL